VILGLDRLLALVGRREKEEEREPGRPARDEELNGRIDAARERLREAIPPPEDEPAVGP
jgi:hypothetical protein